MTYRGDIDGLRALAVLSVIGFHYHVPGFGGGSLGVDIFFVISGYLITRLLMAEISENRFDLLGFYRRRVIRILPALLAMILIICALGSMVLLPLEMDKLSQSGAAASLFSGNIYFWRTAGYFALLDNLPLLHTWSLGVEEQFYILYPVTLWALHRWFGTRLSLILWLGTLIGLMLYYWLAIRNPAAGFYLAPARAWQLSLGGAVALGVPILTRRRDRNVIVILGLALIITAVASSQSVEGTVLDRLVASIGAALLLAYGKDAITERVLTLAPVQWLGRISYSLYLWHYPLLQLYLGGIDPQPASLMMAGVFAASIGAALLSYYLIEWPIRSRHRNAKHSGRIVITGIVASGASAAICLALAPLATWLRPLPAPVAHIASYMEYGSRAEFRYQYGRQDCLGDGFDAKRCMRVDPTKRNIIVFGDSHAAHIWRAITERFPQDNIMLASVPGCRPLYRYSPNPVCRRMIAQIRGMIERGDVQGVVLSASWEMTDFGALGRTIRSIVDRDVAVTMLGPVQRYEHNLPKLLAYSMLGNENFHRLIHRRPAISAIEFRLRPVAETAGATYYSLYDQECPNHLCRLVTRDGAPYHSDRNHLTLGASRELVVSMPRP